MYYKVTKAVGTARFENPEGLQCGGQGFVGKAVMKFGVGGFISIRQKDGLTIDARMDIVEKVAEFDFETAAQLKLITEMENG
jgi:hypothetical protein